MKIAFESYSSRPIIVLLPSSTDPAVAKRSRSISEVAFLLPVLHRGFAEPVVAASSSALGQPGRRDLLGDLLDGVRVGPDRRRQRRVADRPIANGRGEDLFTRSRPAVLVGREEHPVPLEDVSL